MSYAVSYDVPGDEQMYQQVTAAIGDEPPKGLVTHLVFKVPGGLRHIGVWDSPEDFQRFQVERVRPAVHAMLTAVGFTEMPPDPAVDELALVDVTIGG
jgi:hypothetical protein